MRFRTPAAPRVIDPEGRRLIGLTLEGNDPIFAPPGHSSIYGANGSGKSTSVVVPAIQSFASAAPDKAMMVLDSKDGELAAQCAGMLRDMGLHVAVVDDMNTRPELAEFRISLNPYGSLAAACARDPTEVVFASETVTETLIPEPADGDEKNRYFREAPKTLLEFGLGTLLKRSTSLTTPGALAAIIYDPDMLTSFAEIEAEEGTGLLRAQAKAVIDMRGHEHWAQHLEAARRALRIFAPGTRLHEAGNAAEWTHESLIRNGSVTFLIGQQKYMQRLGAYYAAHLMSFASALYSGAGALNFIGDEWSNSPVRELVSSATTLRAYGGALTMVSQSVSEVIRKFGELEAQTLEDNSITKQWLGFSNFKEADKISKALGEQHAVATALGNDGASLTTSTNLSLIKQPHMSAAELMALPKDIGLAHIKGLGFFLYRSISQQNLAPYCNLLADNPLEGGRLPPDPLITLATPEVSS